MSSSPPWRQLPPGVWAPRGSDDGSAILVEFGGETELAARAWLAAPVDAPSETLEVSGRLWSLTMPTAAAGARSWSALPARATLDPDRLFPWPLRADHRLRATHACRTLPGGLAFGVASVEAPWAVCVGPDYRSWRALGPDHLLDRATLNLVGFALRRELPMAERSRGGVRALLIGPHPLAVSALLLPDLALLGASVVGQRDAAWISADARSAPSPGRCRSLGGPCGRATTRSRARSRRAPTLPGAKRRCTPRPWRRRGRCGRRGG